MTFTVFGARGFVGSSLVRLLTEQGHAVRTMERPVEPVSGECMGHVIYAIGLTADFRQRTADAIEAHCHLLARLLKAATFESWLYLSSTRVYRHMPEGQIAQEGDEIRTIPDADGIYDLSKLLGEAVCLAVPRPTVRVARLSNVYGRGQGSTNFLGSLVDSARSGHDLVINEDVDSCKDYVSIEDVASILPLIATRGAHRVYNVASGTLLSHGRLSMLLERHMTGTIRFTSGAPRRAFPQISVRRLADEFTYSPIAPENGIASLLEALKGCPNE